MVFKNKVAKKPWRRHVRAGIAINALLEFLASPLFLAFATQVACLGFGLSLIIVARFSLSKTHAMCREQESPPETKWTSQ
jgi:hypothetical protein